MKKVDELKIGEEFQLGDRRFRIEEEVIDKEKIDFIEEYCIGCFFGDNNLQCAELQCYDLIPQCTTNCRKDNKNVIFKEVKNDKKYRKKPVVIEAIEFKGFENIEEVQKFMKGNIKLNFPSDNENDVYLLIDTLEGTMIAKIGDYIIKGVNGEYYPCEADIFHKTYEEVK